MGSTACVLAVPEAVQGGLARKDRDQAGTNQDLMASVGNLVGVQFVRHLEAERDDNGDCLALGGGD